MGLPLKIAISFDYHFSVRDFLFTPVWDEMAKRPDVYFYLISSNPEVEAEIKARGCENIFFVDPSQVFENYQKTFSSKVLSLINKKWMQLFNSFDARYLFDSLAYRFVAVHNLSHYQIRKKKSYKEQQRNRIFLNYRQGEMAGRPFPKSKVLFRLLYEFRHGFLNLVQREDLKLFKSLAPDVFVFGRLHWLTTAYWSRVMKRLGIPMIGVVASWDHPTVQGPTPRGMSKYVVASKRMLEEMSALHEIEPEKIFQIGKVQMDIFKDESILMEREDFFNELNIPSDHALITFGTNVYTLKDHEVSIAQKLASDFSARRYGRATLLLRTHPQDLDWKTDFLPLEKPPFVICMDGASFGYRTTDNFARGTVDQVFLANLMKHSDVVIQSRGSLALDAIAFDTPVISLAFDGDLQKSLEDSFLWENCYEHYKPLVNSDGTWLAGSYNSLDRAINTYLKDPTHHSSGRDTIRCEHIEPLDGGASRRLIDYLVSTAERARNGQVETGNWAYRGLGDTKWATHQECNIYKFLDK
jgi:hypothetical protein